MRRDFALEAQGADRATHRRLGSERAILGEIVPKEEGTLPPAGARPPAQIAQLSRPDAEDGEGKAAGQGVFRSEEGVSHQQPGQAVALEIIICAPVGSGEIHSFGALLSYGVLDRQGNGDGDLGSPQI